MAATHHGVSPFYVQHARVVIGILGSLGYRFDAGSEFGRDYRGFRFRARSSAYPVQVFNHISDMERVQRQNIRFLGQPNAYLGNLPS